MDNLRALVVKANTRSKRVETNPFKCFGCGLSYSKKDYDILYVNRKLVYFLLLPTKDEHYLLCHDCFTKTMMKACREHNLPSISINVRDGRETFILDFEYHLDDIDLEGLDLSD